MVTLFVGEKAAYALLLVAVDHALDIAAFLSTSITLHLTLQETRHCDVFIVLMQKTKINMVSNRFLKNPFHSLKVNVTVAGYNV